MERNVYNVKQPLETFQTTYNKISCLTKSKITYWEKYCIKIFTSEISNTIDVESTHCELASDSPVTLPHNCSHLEDRLSDLRSPFKH